MYYSQISSTGYLFSMSSLASYTFCSPFTKKLMRALANLALLFSSTILLIGIHEEGTNRI